MRAVVPTPTVLTTSMVPPWRARISLQMKRPRPVPLPASFVVKKGSKIRARSSAGMPRLDNSEANRKQSWRSYSPLLVTGAYALDLCICVLLAIMRKELQSLSLSVFEQFPLTELVGNPRFHDDICETLNQLMLRDF